MLQSLRKLRAGQNNRRAQAQRPVSLRAGFTLVELTFSMSILGFSAVIFGGLMLAISGAWDQATSLEDSRRQAEAALSRIRWMVQQSGTYRISGQSTTVGLGVVPTSWGSYQAPSTLVVWSGGSNGGLNAQGLITRLPVASELAVYAPDSSNPARLVEVTFPGNSTAVDFRSSSFPTTIRSLLTSTSRQSVLLCDRLHVTTSTQSTLPNMGNVRFETSYSPTDTQISSVTVGSQAWNGLSWGQGLVGSDNGLRTVNIRIELLLDPNPQKPATNGGYSTALPFLGSVNRQYVYQQ